METIWEAKARQEAELYEALRLIKIHITSAYEQRDHDLHDAVQKIVTVARENGLLLV